jgi:hypothetical protein
MHVQLPFEPSEPSPVAMFLACLDVLNDTLLRVHSMSFILSLLRVHYTNIHFAVSYYAVSGSNTQQWL